MASRKPIANNCNRSKVASIAGKDFIEFHPSMSLENAPTLSNCLPIPQTLSSSSGRPHLSQEFNKTLENVLAERFHVWTKVTEVIDKLAPAEVYQGDVHVLQKLLQLHFLCKQRETHLRTLQLALLQERQSAPRMEAITNEVLTDLVIETEAEADEDINARSARAKETS